MKRFFVLLVGCLLVLNASAAEKPKTAAKPKTHKSETPLTKGRWFIAPTLTNGGLNVITFKPKNASEGTNAFRFGLQGTGGYALSDKVALEGGTGFQVGTSDGSSMFMFDIFAGARYYAFKNLYVNADLIYATGKIKSDGSDGKANAVQLMAGVGYDFMISEHFAIEPSISYAFSLFAEATNMKFNLGVFSINLGFSYFF